MNETNREATYQTSLFSHNSNNNITKQQKKNQNYNQIK